LAEWNGDGETVGGIVVMRHGENALGDIERVTKRLEELKDGLPQGVAVHTAYDRSGLILRAVDNLQVKLIEECAIVALVCLLFLLHVRSAFVAIVTLPLGILISFVVMHFQGINANIMSLGGIAIAIGVMVDAAVVMVENTHKHIERDGGKKEHWAIVLDAAKEVGPSLFYSLLIVTLSFLPVFTLQAQEGRLFKPLAFTKTWAMAAAALLAITTVPVLMGYLVRGRILPETRNPINRFLLWCYRPVITWVLRNKAVVTGASLLILGATVMPYQSWVLDRVDGDWRRTLERFEILFPFERIGSEFMPPLYEGDLLYMPTTLPGVSITKARELLQQTDRIIRTFPEVDEV
ncbi:MAG: efflux RND transporter permease subunit, partial [Candidatus Latescibacterota bacterium]|nr:efflux RND transporter permease subunit [Candidatus Latescibacterota bacterium]